MTFSYNNVSGKMLIMHFDFCVQLFLLQSLSLNGYQQVLDLPEIYFDHGQNHVTRGKANKVVRLNQLTLGVDATAEYIPRTSSSCQGMVNI